MKPACDTDGLPGWNRRVFLQRTLLAMGGWLAGGFVSRADAASVSLPFAFAQVPVLPRSAWTVAGPVKPRVPMRDAICRLTVHHDEFDNGFFASDREATAHHLERIRAYHARNGFQDIGYHFAIDRAGRAWELRPVGFRGEHVRPGPDAGGVLRKWNDGNLGIVVLGNFMVQEPAPAQKAALCVFSSRLRRKYGIPADNVHGHGELVGTTCPGIHLRAFLDLARRRGWL